MRQLPFHFLKSLKMLLPQAQYAYVCKCGGCLSAFSCSQKMLLHRRLSRSDRLWSDGCVSADWPARQRTFDLNAGLDERRGIGMVLVSHTLLYPTPRRRRPLAAGW